MKMKYGIIILLIAVFIVIVALYPKQLTIKDVNLTEYYNTKASLTLDLKYSGVVNGSYIDFDSKENINLGNYVDVNNETIILNKNCANVTNEFTKVTGLIGKAAKKVTSFSDIFIAYYLNCQ
jgi:hypothetical protein